MLIKTIVKKGNSNFVLISKDFLDSLGIETGDKVITKLEGNKIVISPVNKPENE